MDGIFPEPDIKYCFKSVSGSRSEGDCGRIGGECCNCLMRSAMVADGARIKDVGQHVSRGRWMDADACLPGRGDVRPSVSCRDLGGRKWDETTNLIFAWLVS